MLENKFDEIIFIKKDMDFLKGLMEKLHLKKISRTEFSANINEFNNLGENKKILCRARLNFILENTTPLSYMGPLISYVVSIINLFILYITREYKGADYYYVPMIVINVFFLLLFMWPYRSEKTRISQCKYLLELLK